MDMGHKYRPGQVLRKRQNISVFLMITGVVQEEYQVEVHANDPHWYLVHMWSEPLKDWGLQQKVPEGYLDGNYDPIDRLTALVKFGFSHGR